MFDNAIQYADTTHIQHERYTSLYVNPKIKQLLPEDWGIALATGEEFYEDVPNNRIGWVSGVSYIGLTSNGLHHFHRHGNDDPTSNFYTL